MTQPLEIPLVHGLAQQIDPKLMPAGYLNRAENVRMRKDGRWGKRFGYATLTDPGSGPVHGLYSLGEESLVAATGQLYTRHADGTYKTQGALTRFLPGVESNVVSTTATQFRYGNSAYSAGFVATIFVDTSAGNNLVYLRVQEYLSGADSYRIYTVPAGTVTHARVVATTGGFTFVWLDGTTLKHAVFTLSTLTIGSTINVATVSAASSLFDASEFTGGGTYLVVYKSAATTLRIAKIQANGTELSGANITTASSVCRATICDCTERVYTAWLEESSGKIRVISHTTSLASPSAIADAAASGVASTSPKPVLVRSDATHAMVFWGDKASSLRTMKWRTVSDAAALGTATTSDGLWPASKPFVVSSQIHLWVMNGEDGELQCAYHLIAPDVMGVAGTFMPMLTWAENRGSREQGFVPGSVYVTSDGYFWGAHVIAARLIESSSYVGFSNINFFRGNTAMLDRRQAVALNGTLYLAGGELAFFDGEAVANLGSRNYPFINSVVDGGAGGSLTGGGAYKWIITFEFVDKAGQRHQSEPSTPVGITLAGGSGTAVVSYRALSLGQYGNEASLSLTTATRPMAVLWRTLAGGTIYYRVSTTVLNAYGSLGFIDTTADSDIAANETLYTLGGPLPHATAPACRYIALGSERALIAGFWDPDRYQFSKITTPGEPLQFADHDAFRGVVQGAITAVACMDDVWVIFTETSVFLVAGTGPDDSGNGVFQAPRRLPSDVGCIDWRSLLEIPDGLVFQSSRGLYLLPRGFGAPQFIGQPVADTLAAYPHITSAALVVNAYENTARWTLSANEDQSGATDSGATLVLDLRSKVWTVDLYADGKARAAAALWGGNYVSSGIDLGFARALRLEQANVWRDDEGSSNASIVPVLELGDLRPFGQQGHGLARTIQALGELRSASTLKIEASYDAGQTYPYSASFALTGNAGDQIAREWAPPRSQFDELRLRLSDVGSGSQEGFVLNALTLQLEQRRGARRFESGARA